MWFNPFTLHNYDNCIWYREIYILLWLVFDVITTWNRADDGFEHSLLVKIYAEIIDITNEIFYFITLFQGVILLGSIWRVYPMLFWMVSMCSAWVSTLPIPIVLFLLQQTQLQAQNKTREWWFTLTRKRNLNAAYNNCYIILETLARESMYHIKRRTQSLHIYTDIYFNTMGLIINIIHSFV